MMNSQIDQPTKINFPLLQEKLTITAITWNLFGSLPSSQALAQLFQQEQLSPTPDLIFFGTQECERSLFASFCCEPKQIWEAQLADICPSHYLAATHTMRGLHIAILLKKSLRDYFELQQKRGKLRAGVPCNTMGNKGAICIQFSLLGQQFQLINCHLAANQEEFYRRNQTIHRIMEEMVQEEGICQVIFLGDFNYRIDMGKHQYQQLIAGKSNTDAELNYSSMVDRDQLYGQKELKSNFLQKFEEGSINFPPTYKIGLHNNEYSRERIPGWTDRIFHRRGGKLIRNSYSCGYDIMSCDHRPVIACYQQPLDEHAFSLISTQNLIGVRGQETCQLI